jgi:hypothetical protein
MRARGFLSLGKNSPYGFEPSLSGRHDSTSNTGAIVGLMKSFLMSLVLAVTTISAYSQTTQPSTSEWSAKSKRAAEDAVADRIEMMRAAAKRPALKRVNPSVSELELVCTAAFTGKRLFDQ